MNILPFVFAILLILSYGTSAAFQSRIESRRNQKAHLGLRKAELHFLRQNEKENYKELPGTPVKIEKEKKAFAHKAEKKAVVPVPINPNCCRLNLFPLLDEGKNRRKELYEITAKLLRVFYSKALFSTEKDLEYKLLDAILAAGKRSLKEEFSLPIETLDLQNPELQAIYYTALKGTKKCALGQKGYPPLIDYLKIERKNEHICLFDAHPDLLAIFFGLKTAKIVHETLRDGQKQSIDLDTIIQIANDPKLALISPEVWELLNFNRPTHGSASRRTLIAEDAETGISLRKEIQLRQK